MVNSATYVLKGYGSIDPRWVQNFFNLFKEQEVNIRKLLLTKNGNPVCFSMLEVHFTLSVEQEAQADLGHPFLEKLQNRLAEQHWTKRSLGQL
jgi:hypothetical protein